MLIGQPIAMLLLLLTLCLTPVVRASIPANWIEYTPGTCNVIISSPHGGSNQASEIPLDRTDGCLDGAVCRWEKGCSPADANQCGASTARDSYTQEIAAQVAQILTANYNCKPHFVRSNLHRCKLDPNRDSDEAAQGDAAALEAWQLYHEQYMSTAVASVRTQFGKGLVFDIHGQGHSEQWTELGYQISSYNLDRSPSSLAGSCIRGLWNRNGATAEAAAQLLTGDKSFGYQLEKHGHKVVPGPTYKSPNGGNYFNGGYIVGRYGSKVSGDIDAIQIEISSGIRKNATRRDGFAADLAEAIDEFRRARGYV